MIVLFLTSAFSFISQVWFRFLGPFHAHLAGLFQFSPAPFEPVCKARHPHLHVFDHAFLIMSAFARSAAFYNLLHADLLQYFANLAAALIMQRHGMRGARCSFRHCLELNSLSSLKQNQCHDENARQESTALRMLHRQRKQLADIAAALLMKLLKQP